MRYKRTLNKEQVEFLIKNSHLTNEELANKFNTTKETIATYKYRARKAGINVPDQRTASIRTEMTEIAKKLG